MFILVLGKNPPQKNDPWKTSPWGIDHGKLPHRKIGPKKLPSVQFPPPMTWLQPGYQTITIHILRNISQSKGN